MKVLQLKDQNVVAFSTTRRERNIFQKTLKDRLLRTDFCFTIVTGKQQLLQLVLSAIVVSNSATTHALNFSSPIPIILLNCAHQRAALPSLYTSKIPRKERNVKCLHHSGSNQWQSLVPSSIHLYLKRNLLKGSYLEGVVGVRNMGWAEKKIQRIRST